MIDGVQLSGRRAWSITMSGTNATLSHALAVRIVADLPVYDIQVPEPLIPEPPGMRIAPRAAARRAAAPQWAAWWRIVWDRNVAGFREAPTGPEHSLLGLAPLYMEDPPKFPSLAATPELRQIVEASWPALSTWVAEISDLDPWVVEDRWPQDLIGQAETQLGRPIADVHVRLEVLPVAGLRHWILTEDPNRHLVHALVTPEMATERTRLGLWLPDVLQRIG